MTVALALPSITSLTCHVLAIVLLPLLAIALVLVRHARRSRTLVMQVRRTGERGWSTAVVRSHED